MAVGINCLWMRRVEGKTSVQRLDCASSQHFGWLGRMHKPWLMLFLHGSNSLAKAQSTQRTCEGMTLTGGWLEVDARAKVTRLASVGVSLGIKSLAPGRINAVSCPIVQQDETQLCLCRSKHQRRMQITVASCSCSACTAWIPQMLSASAEGLVVELALVSNIGR